MNYYYQNRAKRLGRQFAKKTKRGIIYPSIKEILKRSLNGEDTSNYIYDTPFIGGTHRYLEFDEILNNNRMYMERIRSLTSKSQTKTEVEAKEERSDDDNETKE